MPCPRPTARRALPPALALTLLAGAPAAAADPSLLYLRHEAAVVVHDGLGASMRQAPVLPDARWPAARTVGKVSGAALAAQDTAGMVALLRSGWNQPAVGGFVAVDEIAPRAWGPLAAARLTRALDLMGGDAKRVMFYAAPSFVEQVGRVDPRSALPPGLGALVDAVSRGRATYLVTYRGDMSAMPAREMATHPTRWLARWPAGRGELRISLGADGGVGQAELWTRVRSTAAGRALLGRGPAAYGLDGAGEAHEWVAQYRAFRAAPGISATGIDYAVPVGGGLTLTRLSGQRVRVTLGRPGRAVVTMTPVRGGKVRAIRKLIAPAPPTVIRLPRDSRPGLYRIGAVLIGDGLRDRAAVVVRIPPRR